MAQGAGFIWDKAGHVVTNFHVIEGADTVYVQLQAGDPMSARVIGGTPEYDIAVVRLHHPPRDLQPLPIGTSKNLTVGQATYAIGNPFGLTRTLTTGIVSAIERHLPTAQGREIRGVIQTDAAINPGNSGGALVDVDGALVGVNTAIYSRSGGSIGIGFAIPADMVRSVVAQAVAGSSTVARVWIGVVCQDVTPDIASSLGVASPRGALVAHVDQDSPGGKAGLKVGDLIMKAGDRDIGDAAAFDYRLAVTGIGNSVALQVWRDGVLTPISVTPEAEPELNEADLTLIGGRSPLTGAVVADLSASLADRMHIRGAESGAVIVDIEPMSPAARMGFQAGDVLLSVQGEDVASAKQLAELAEAGGRVWRISFNRGGQVSSIVIGG